MTTRWTCLLPIGLPALVLALSCGSNKTETPNSSAGLGGTAGTGGSSGSGNGGAKPEAGAGNEAGASAGSAGASAGQSGEGGAAGGDEGGAGGAVAVEDKSPLSPSEIPDLAFWLDGNAQSYSDIDENYATPADSGRVRSVPEAPPLTGSWQAPSSAERPIRDVGALMLRPVESETGYYLKDTAGTIQTDDSTIAISLRPLFGEGGPPSGGISGLVGDSVQPMGISFVGNGIGLYFNHTQVSLAKRLSRAVHVTIIARFTSTGVKVQYDINGLRSSESIEATIDHDTASRFAVGFDPHNHGSIYGYVSQVVGINRAVSDAETNRMMTWLTTQPMPAAFPVSKPLIAILGDSIANGGWGYWPFSMLSDLSDTSPDLQLLNASTNGAGIPKVKNSDYSDVVLPWYSQNRAKNVLLVAAGTNDLANGAVVSDLLDRYYGLLDSARATGWKTVACTVLPRSNAGMVVGVSGFETARAAFNADVLAHWASHADALANVAAVGGMGAAGDSNNSTYYADQIHPTTVGHALIEPVYLAAVKGLL